MSIKPGKLDAVRRAVADKSHRSKSWADPCRRWSGMSFMLMTMVSGIYLPTLVENGIGWGLPFEHNSEVLRDDRSLEEFSRSVNPVNQNVYLFALDCSSSIEERLPEIPSWYARAYQELRDASYPVSYVEGPGAYDVAKVGFYYLLSRLVDAAPNYPGEEVAEGARPTDEFALWDVCGDGDKFFPPLELTTSVNYRNAVSVMHSLETRDLSDDSRTTRFLELFRQIDKTYQISGQSYGGKNSGRMFIVTVVSDFLDDPGAPPSTSTAMRTEREREWMVEKRKRQIEQAAQALLSGRVVVNVVVVSEDAAPADAGTIVSFMRDNVEWYEFNEFSIVDDLTVSTDRMLYPVYRIRRPLRIYYQKRSEVDGTFTLKVEEPGVVALSLAALERDPLGTFALDYGYRGGDGGRNTEIRGRLAAGQSVRLHNLPGNTTIFLKYTGAVPDRDQTLKISVGSERRTYLVPIRFVPRLPHEVARALLLLAGFAAFFGLAAIAPYGWGLISGVVSPSRYTRDI